MRRRPPEEERRQSPPQRPDPGHDAAEPTGRTGPEEALQRTLGNRAVQALDREGELRPRLEVSSPGDRYEREAERVSRAVVKASDPTAVPDSDGTVQRSEAAGGDRSGPEPRGRSAVGQRDRSGAESSGRSAGEPASRRFDSLRGSGRPLPEPARSYFEPRFGSDFGHVRVHTGSGADEAARSVNARAFTLGRDVVFSEGSYDPGSRGGRKLLAHELTHVVQQTGRPAAGQRTADGARVERRSGGRVARQDPKGESGRRLGTVHDESVDGDMWGDPVESDVAVRSHSVEEWQAILKNASSRNNALELNSFMALSVGEDLYLATYDKSERRAMSAGLASMDRPGKDERANLMIAMLTTKGIDLEDTTVVGTAGGYLLPTFIEQNLGYAVARIQQRTERKGGYSKHSVKPGAVQGLLSQASGAWADVEDLYTPAQTHYGRYGVTKYTTPARNNMEKVGAGGTLPDRSPTDVLVDQAVAGAQTAAFGAIISSMATGNTDRKQARQERFKRQIEQYGRMLSGVAMERERIKKRNEAIISGAVDTAFAALGPLGGGLSVGLQIGKGVATTAIKNATVAMATGLAGEGGEGARDRFVTAFWSGLEEYTSDMLRDDDLEFPPDFGDLKDQLKGAFERGLNL